MGARVEAGGLAPLLDLIRRVEAAAAQVQPFCIACN